MLLTKCIVLGHHVSSQGIKVYLAKIEVIVSLPSPKTQNEVRIFLGHVGDYRCFIENFTKIVAPLFKMLMKDIEFQWNESCQSDFEVLKDKILVAPILRGHDLSLPFRISTGASNIAIGGVLG